MHDLTIIRLLLLANSLLLVGAGFAVQSGAAAEGLWRILLSPSLLLTDYTVLGGIGPALLNAGLLGCIVWTILKVIRLEHPGYLLVCGLMVPAFGLCGKNLLNIWPHIFGVILFARVTQKPLRELGPVMLLGTCLAPLFSHLGFGFGFGAAGLAGGAAAGTLAGFLLASISGHMLTLHQGFSLYNVGTAAGFLGIIASTMMRGFGLKTTPVFLYATESSELLHGLLILLLSTLALLGVFLSRKDGKSLTEGLSAIFAETGKLPSNFVEAGGLGPTLFNMALVGSCGLAYLDFVGGPVNGPTFAAITAMTAFGSLGKHPRNILPALAGVYLICLPKIWSPGDPGPVLAALYSGTVAPFCGRFGPLAGLAAGMLHLPLAMHLGEVHGWLNLYNNGFAGGIGMIFFVGVVRGLSPHLLDQPAPSLPSSGGTTR
ncbi:MAG TPA: DUF1576 domain-containing protein [Candidatus Ozemobacteraceae bacterium]|nr:DUF1576 domain-containing protein [Candidatus Ozemobacteraceae bacterium]